MRKIKNILRYIFMLSLIALIIMLIKNVIFSDKENNNYFNKEEVKINEKVKETNKTDYKDYITTKSEKNDDEVKEFISDGMELENFKNTISMDSSYIKPSGKYKPVNYNFEKHYTYKELSNIYEKLSISEIVRLEIIGKSVDKQDIYSLEIGSGNEKIMLEGNIHAAEIAPTLFLTKFAVDIINEWESGKTDTQKLLEKYKFIILPSINPDGYDYAIFGKKTIDNKDLYVYKNDNEIDQKYYKANLNGVDLNRNLPSQLGGLYLKDYELHPTVVRNKSPERLEYFPGYKLGSEPETQALIYWMYKHYAQTKAYLSIHSAGRVIYNGKPNMSDKFNDYSRQCAELFNNYSKYTILNLEDEIDGDGTDGTSTDMITEIIHGFKFSSKTGRLSGTKYITQVSDETLLQDMCVLTIETLENYTQNLVTISEEWEEKKLKKSIIEVAKYEFE